MLFSSRYLVVEKRMLLWAERDLTVETLVQNLDLVLRVLPEEALTGQQANDQAQHSDAMSNTHEGRQRSGSTTTPNPTDLASSSTLDQDMAAAIRASTHPDAEAGTTNHNDDVRYVEILLYVPNSFETRNSSPSSCQCSASSVFRILLTAL